MIKDTRFNPPRFALFPVVKAGYPFIIATGILAAVFAVLGVVSVTILACLLSLFICYFFRDPNRHIPKQSDAVVSPADGKIIKAEPVGQGPAGAEDCVKISIFMSVFNVHVNRIPQDGKVTRIDYEPGKFFSANLDKASEKNEHNSVFLETSSGNKICFVQIAGLIARRIICKIKAGDSVARGDRFGMICFGSRVDVYLPGGTDLRVSVGNRVKAGTSILGYLT